jgi:hypothetical protein
MVKAGFLPRTFTVRADSPAAVAALLRRRLTPAEIAEVAAILAGYGTAPGTPSEVG